MKYLLTAMVVMCILMVASCLSPEAETARQVWADHYTEANADGDFDPEEQAESERLFTAFGDAVAQTDYFELAITGGIAMISTMVYRNMGLPGSKRKPPKVATLGLDDKPPVV
jgi:hypothetical protein